MSEITQTPADRAAEKILNYYAFRSPIAMKEFSTIIAAEYAPVIAEMETYRAALERLENLDWVITPADRMDAVRKIARDALLDGKGEK